MFKPTNALLSLAIIIISFSITGCRLSGLGRPASFTPLGQVLIMKGVINIGTPGALRRALKRNPGIRTSVMLDVPGSINDSANIRAARLVRQKGLSTYIPYNGYIASGGTDFFMAGITRTMEHGAQIGVHSWRSNLHSGRSLPRNHPDHNDFLSYFSYININPDFYWFTLRAAPHHQLHIMSYGELRRFRVVTHFTKSRRYPGL